MNTYNAGEYDVAVIGGGHAGCEAALASSRLGAKTILFAINLDSIANLPCNPSIGGTAKGHLVREIDALGGEMGKVADSVFIQSRMLNKSRGPAVYSLRVQADRRAYQTEMKKRLEQTPNLDVRQAEIVDISPSWKVTTQTGAVFSCKKIIIATGTFLQGRIITGETSYSGGPDGLFAANNLSAKIKALGIELMRFKTGTPSRIKRGSVDFSNLTVQKGDDEITPFSFETKEILPNRADCYLLYTNEKTHQIIRDNLHRSPLYSGDIKGVGPRYCPSIEDKVVRFADKARHQLFLEPMGLLTDEMYLQGMSSSLPEDVQLAMIRSIVGLENAHIMRFGYAIEYDCAVPTQMNSTLEFKNHPGLYGAGQFNGSSGYEEAAAQGLIAGINAALSCSGREQITMPREESYIGVLIDDLVTKGPTEPYRMMTARAEHRLLLRQDNADARLTPLGYKIGLIGPERYERFLSKQENIEREIARLRSTFLPPSKVNTLVDKPVASGVRLSDLLKRPEITYERIASIDEECPSLSKYETEAVEISVKYEGYIARQKDILQNSARLNDFIIPDDIDYSLISGIRIEARQKLDAIRPGTLAQASRISGVNPADLNVLMIAIKMKHLQSS